VWHRQPKELISKIIGAVCVLPFYFLLFTHIFLKVLFSRHDSVTAISRSSHMVGPLKNSSNRISRTNTHMHANKDIWEIGQIMTGKGMRVAKQAKEVKEATMGMMVTRGPATTAVMELVATTAVTMGPVTSQAMTTTRVATTTGLVTTVTTMGPAATTGLVAMTEPVTTRMSDIWGRRIG
jgi:hypothetical protein